MKGKLRGFRMKRLLIVSGMIAGMVVAMSPAAFAKGAGQVVISGPGLAKPLVLRGAPGQSGPGDFWEFMSNTGLLNDSRQAAAPEGALGPRYKMVVFISATDSPNLKFDLKKAARFTAYGYPYAEPGPWFYVAVDQQAGDFGVIPGGWSFGADAARYMLIDKGLPKTSPVPLAPAPLQPIPAPAASVIAPTQPLASEASPWTHIWIAVVAGAALALLTIGGALTGRRVRAAHSAA